MEVKALTKKKSQQDSQQLQSKKHKQICPQTLRLGQHQSSSAEWTANQEQHSEIHFCSKNQNLQFLFPLLKAVICWHWQIKSHLVSDCCATLQNEKKVPANKCTAIDENISLFSTMHRPCLILSTFESAQVYKKSGTHRHAHTHCTLRGKRTCPLLLCLATTPSEMEGRRGFIDFLQGLRSLASISSKMEEQLLWRLCHGSTDACPAASTMCPAPLNCSVHMSQGRAKQHHVCSQESTCSYFTLARH